MSSDEAARGGPATGAFATLLSRPDGRPPSRLKIYALRLGKHSRLLFAADDDDARAETAVTMRQLLAERPDLGRVRVSLFRASEQDVAAYSTAWLAGQSAQPQSSNTF